MPGITHTYKRKQDIEYGILGATAAFVFFVIHMLEIISYFGILKPI